MLKQILKFRIFIVISLILMLFCSATLAWDGRYRYRRGRWYRDRDWFWFSIGGPTITIGTVVSTLPPTYSIVFFGNMPYYYYDDFYYRPYYPSGYIVVPAPAQPAIIMPKTSETTTVYNTVIVHNPPAAITQQDSFTVNIPNPNSKGEYIPVTLKRVNNGFTGPQGEFYKEFPSIEQLQVMYGNKGSH
ncbi:MAG: hypothetical protein PHX78_04045 [bacterium]|nr:hypothetical protein [bacterium]